MSVPIKLSLENEHLLRLSQCDITVKRIISPFLGRIVDRYNSALHYSLCPNSLENPIPSSKFLHDVNMSLHDFNVPAAINQIPNRRVFETVQDGKVVRTFNAGFHVTSATAFGDALNLSEKIKAGSGSILNGERGHRSTYSIKYCDKGVYFRNQAAHNLSRDIGAGFGAYSQKPDRLNLDFGKERNARMITRKGSCLFNCDIDRAGENPGLQSFSLKTWHPNYAFHVSINYNIKCPGEVMIFSWRNTESETLEMRPTMISPLVCEDRELVLDLILASSRICGVKQFS